MQNLRSLPSSALKTMRTALNVKYGKELAKLGKDTEPFDWNTDTAPSEIRCQLLQEIGAISRELSNRHRIEMLSQMEVN